jgi:sec-independent protein translocase protein TatA
MVGWSDRSAPRDAEPQPAPRYPSQSISVKNTSMFRNPLTDSIVALLVLLVIFGPKRLPLLGRSLGRGIREFRNSITDRSEANEPERPALMPAQTVMATSPQTVPPAQAPSQQ